MGRTAGGRRVRPRTAPELTGGMVNAMDAVFEPVSVAVYGASRDPRKLGNRGSLQRIIDAIGGLLVRDAEVVEVDSNPVMVREGRPLVVDVLVEKR